jgi:hypothetical protein
MNFFSWLRKPFRLKSFERGDYTSAEDRPVENLDAGALAAGRGASEYFGGSAPGYPPGYVKDYDDGRPRN